MIKFRIFLLGLVAFASSSAHALPVEYRFSGELTGDIYSLFVRQNFVNTPFQVSIFADTDDVSPTGYIAGAGSGYANNSASAIWSVDGFGNATSSDVQIYSLPGLARIGFGWNGQVFPLNTDQPAQTHLYFNGNEIATNSSFSRLSSAVAPISVGLQTALKNPPNMIPEYTTSIYFDGLGPLTLKSLSSVNYSVVAVPEPSNLALLLAGLGFVATALKRQRVALG